MVKEGLNDAGVQYIIDSRHICECGWSLPFDPQPAAGYFPNWERMMEHQKSCAAHLAAWEEDKRWCPCHKGFVHKDYMLAGYCERCWEHGE